jgi:hypothetical protein
VRCAGAPGSAVPRQFGLSGPLPHARWLPHAHWGASAGRSQAAGCMSHCRCGVWTTCREQCAPPAHPPIHPATTHTHPTLPYPPTVDTRAPSPPIHFVDLGSVCACTCGGGGVEGAPGTAVPVADATVELLRPSIAPPVSAVLGSGAGRGAGAGAGGGHGLSAVEGGILSVCKAGRYLGIVWPHLKCYAIYDSSIMPGCDLVDSGVGVDIAWCWAPYTRPNGESQGCGHK